MSLHFWHHEQRKVLMLRCSALAFNPQTDIAWKGFEILHWTLPSVCLPLSTWHHHT